MPRWSADVLPFGGEVVEYLLDIGHVEIAAQTEVLRPPVVAAEERVYVFQSAFACGGITKMTHVQFAGEGGTCAWVIGVGGGSLAVDGAEHLGDGVLALRFFAVHVFVAGGLMDVDAGDTGPFLTPVVLLLHHQVEFAEGIMAVAVLHLVECLGLEQANHRHPAFMF